MKLPKIKIPERTKGSGGAGGRSRFLKRNLLSLIVIAVLAIGTGTVYGTLSSSDADRGANPVNGVNQDRYQVLVSGKGYKLSKKQEKDYKLQKKQNEINATNAAHRTPTTFRSYSGSRVFRSGTYSYRGRTFTMSKNPRLSSNISDQISTAKDKGTPKAGDTIDFRVSAYAYPYGTKNVISSDDIKVTVSGGKVTLVKSGKRYSHYTLELGSGTNKITITAKDKKTKKTAKLGPYIIKAGKSNGGGGGNTEPSSDTPTPQTITVTATSGDLGYGLVPVSLSADGIDESASVSEALSKMSGVSVDDTGSISISMDTSNFSLAGAADDSALQQKFMDEKGLSEMPEDDSYAEWLDAAEKRVQDKGKVGPGYPFDTTGWTAGGSTSSGITLTLTLY